MTDQPGQPFEPPTGQAASQGEENAATQQFATPPSGAGEAEQASFLPEFSSLTAGFSTQLLDAHGALAEALKGQSRSGVRVVSLEEGGDGVGNIEGVGLGLGEPGDGPPGQPTLNVFVATRTTPDKVREAVVDGLGVQAAGDLPLTIRRSGEFRAQEFNFRIRPAPGGVSVGHYRITAGTLGCLAIGRNEPRNHRLMALSNNHVLANSNNGVFGDAILQPGTYDGGSYPNDQIAITERFVPLQFGGANNYVDCATGWCWPDRVRPELIYRYGGNLYLFRIGSAPQYATLGGVVGKTGRTTELTQGRVVSTNWSGWVNYGVGYAWYIGQFVVQGTGADFSLGGDSGSVIWRWEAGLPPVGLLFAGGGGYTIANPMPWVTYFLDIGLYT
jgi:hypothetical protein